MPCSPPMVGIYIGRWYSKEKTRRRRPPLSLFFTPLSLSLLHTSLCLSPSLFYTSLPLSLTHISPLPLSISLSLYIIIIRQCGLFLCLLHRHFPGLRLQDYQHGFGRRRFQWHVEIDSSNFLPQSLM